MAKKSVAYDEKAIQSLDALSHIRLRTGMYIGRLGDGSNPSDGIYVMLKEVIDNSIDEYIMGEGKRVEIAKEGDRLTIRDYGRGIPLGKVVDCVSQINTGGKYNDDVFQFSVGLNGVGTKAVNALSSDFEVTSFRDGKFVRARFERGELKEQKKGKAPDKDRGTQVTFIPDTEIFGEYNWLEKFVENRLQYYAFLNTGLSLIYNGNIYRSKDGLKDLLRKEMGETRPLYEPAHFQGDRLEFAFTHSGEYGENYYSFVNGQYTNDGGTHQSAFREGMLKGVQEFSGIQFSPEDVRDGIIGAVAVKVQDPVFESQTKNKLGSTGVRSWVMKEVQKQVVLWLHKHAEEAEKLVEKVKLNEKVRKELASIKKKAKERAKKVAIRIPKLTDCKVHLDDKDGGGRGEESSIFLVEGDSAGGTLVTCRDVETQAVFSLRGKPLNCHGLKLDAVYKNEELYNVMCALGIENGLEGLRYNRVVIATDADVDGKHIRNLLITYFLRYFESLVVRGHLYVLETPLFKVANKKENRYCFTDEEADAAEKELGKASERTRFKGLGEVDANEMKKFLLDPTLIQQVTVENLGEIQTSLDFFMGKNTPARRNFIVENLIQDLT